MKLTFSKEWQCFAVSADLLQILERTVDPLTHNEKEWKAITLNFRDPDYSSIEGGFHPVEIRLENTANGWKFNYITDFSYQGTHGMSELEKELDFLFPERSTYHLYTGLHRAEDSAPLFKLWQGNFVSYVQMGVFEVEVQVT